MCVLGLTNKKKLCSVHTYNYRDTGRPTLGNYIRSARLFSKLKLTYGCTRKRCSTVRGVSSLPDLSRRPLFRSDMSQEGTGAHHRVYICTYVCGGTRTLVSQIHHSYEQFSLLSKPIFIGTYVRAFFFNPADPRGIT